MSPSYHRLSGAGMRESHSRALTEKLLAQKLDCTLLGIRVSMAVYDEKLSISAGYEGTMD